MYIGDTVIYDLRLALNEDSSTINNNTVWNDISSNKLSIKLNESDEELKTSLIIYAVNELLSATWKKIILKKDNFSTFPNFSYLTFDGPEEGILKFYNNTISMEIIGFESLSEIQFGCVQKLLTLDISDNGLTPIDIDHMQENIRSITMRNMNPEYIFIIEPSLEYLDMTNTTSNSLYLSGAKLKTLIGFTPDTLITVEKEGENGIVETVLPSLSLMDFKMPIRLENFPSFDTLTLTYNDYFPTGLDTIKNITQLTIINCKNNNKIRNFCIDNCNKINLSYILSLNSVKIDNNNLEELKIIGNIDLLSLELPEQDLSNIPVILYANINLSEIICNGISYGKEDSENDLVDLCELLMMKLCNYDNEIDHTNNVTNFANCKHKLGFNKLYIKEEFDNYNINPQIYKNRELIGDPLTEKISFRDILGNNKFQYYYIKLRNPINTSDINNIHFPNRLAQNAIDYNDNNITITGISSDVFIALGLNDYTAESLVAKLNETDYGSFVFTDKPNLLKGVKNHIIINPFNYTPNLPNVFGIKLVVY